MENSQFSKYYTFLKLIQDIKGVSANMYTDCQKSNELAMNALQHGDFKIAQELFRQNCKKFPGVQTYNNLGIFYYENGMELSSGKIRSAHTVGKRYLLKSCLMQKTPIVLSNLGRIEYEYEKDFVRAFKYYDCLYELERNQDVVYNRSVALYQLNEYQEVVDSLISGIESDPEYATLYLFALLQIGRMSLKEILIHPILPFGQVDTDLMILLYFSLGMYERVTELSENLLSEFTPNEVLGSILIESFLKCGKSIEQISEIVCNRTDGYVETKVRSLLNGDIRKKYIEQADSYFYPVIRPTCGYFGCQIHHTTF